LLNVLLAVRLFSSRFLTWFVPVGARCSLEAAAVTIAAPGGVFACFWDDSRPLTARLVSIERRRPLYRLNPPATRYRNRSAFAGADNSLLSPSIFRGTYFNSVSHAIVMLIIVEFNPCSSH